MGVPGSGKTVVGRAMVDRLNAPFCEGDALHPAAINAQMRVGRLLNDANRAPWLDQVFAAADPCRNTGQTGCHSFEQSIGHAFPARGQNRYSTSL